jgi:hypothetical protein
MMRRCTPWVKTDGIQAFESPQALICLMEAPLTLSLEGEGIACLDLNRLGVAG